MEQYVLLGGDGREKLQPRHSSRDFTANGKRQQKDSTNKKSLPATQANVYVLTPLSSPVYIGELTQQDERGKKTANLV